MMQLQVLGMPGKTQQYANNYLPGFLAGEAGVLSDRGFVVAGQELRVLLQAPFTLHWGINGWQSVQDTDSEDWGPRPCRPLAGAKIIGRKQRAVRHPEARREGYGAASGTAFRLST